MSCGAEYCGFELLSEVELPELRVVTHPQDPLLTISQARRSPGIDAGLADRWPQSIPGEFSARRVGSRYLIQFEDGAAFAFDTEARTVTCPTTLDATGRHQLLDHVLPRVLDHLGHLMIHGGAIATQRGAVVFIGDSGQGKSTLVASFHDAGVEVLSDDCLRVTIDRDTAGCVPTYRSLRLWPDSAGAVMADAASAPMAANADKRRIMLPAQPTVGTTPVAAVCVLGAPSDPSSPVSFAEAAPARAVSLLLAQCFRLDPTDKFATARTFDQCVDVVERVPVVELRYPRDYGRLPEVRDAVLQRAEADGWADLTAS